MNRENIQKAIAIMKRAEDDHFDMCDWQSDLLGLAKTIDELHGCGNTACFAGYIAMAPEFKEDGGQQDIICGDPEFPRDGTNFFHSGADAVAAWLDISKLLAYLIVHNFDGDHVYLVPYNDVKPKHVIEVLQNILDGQYGKQRFSHG